MRASDIQLYRACDGLSEVLIYLLVVFTPWAFGTTQPWSIWTTNVIGYLLGLLLTLKCIIRRFQQYHPPRWDSAGRERGSIPGLLTGPRLTVTLAALTALILGYCLLSAVNARATFRDNDLTFEYRDCIRWLPHSLDAGGTWFAFWTYLGLACSFWAVWDWLLGMSDGEQRAYWQMGHSAQRSHGEGAWAEADGKSRAEAEHFGTPVPARLSRLLWLLAINGALLGMEGMIQRVLGSPKLLFLVTPRIHQIAESQFGPYAYRSNAAQYFNLLWPTCLGFWWTLNRASASTRRGHHALLVCAAVMAACPLLSTSRGGAVVMLGMAGATAVVLGASQMGLAASRGEGFRKSKVTRYAASEVPAMTPLPMNLRGGMRGKRPPLPSPLLQRRRGRRSARFRGSMRESLRENLTPALSPSDGERVQSGRSSERAQSSMSFGTAGLAMFFLAALGLGLSLGYPALKPRLTSWNEALASRERLYAAARPMAADYPWFGTGPGTFETVSQLYLPPDAYRRPQLHNDWLETRITFGWSGSALLALAVAVVGLRWFVPGGIRGGRRFVQLTWLALAGCLAHARFDFPFQVQSIVVLAVVMGAVLFCVSRKG